jgi:pyridoxal phosphate enzyme (YggS family)
MSTSVSANLAQVRKRIELACLAAGRPASAVHLLAVSKTMPAQAVRDAYAAGQVAFGENYIQEGVDKIATLADLPLEWHCIGPIQSNKTKLVAENFAWVHSIDRLKIAERLSAQRPANLPALQICLRWRKPWRNCRIFNCAAS